MHAIKWVFMKLCNKYPDQIFVKYFMVIFSYVRHRPLQPCQPYLSYFYVVSNKYIFVDELQFQKPLWDRKSRFNIQFQICFGYIFGWVWGSKFMRVKGIEHWDSCKTHFHPSLVSSSRFAAAIKNGLLEDSYFEAENTCPYVYWQGSSTWWFDSEKS